MSLELHLVDIPASWFAQAFELLGESARSGDEVLPELRAGPAATPDGLNIHWTFGDFRAAG